MRPTLFRCSSIGRMMTAPASIDPALLTPEVEAIQAKKERTGEEKALLEDLKLRTLSEGAKSYIRELVRQEIWGVDFSFSSKYTENGKAVEAEGLAREWIAMVGLEKFEDSYPHELSGGQARRVCVARALALNPALVIADEPTAGLDVSVQGEILNLMADLKTRLGLSFLVISHNLSMVRHVTDRIAILYLGRMVEIGPTAAVFAKPLHPYTQSLIASEPQPDPRKRRADLGIKGEIPSVLRRPKGCEFHTRCTIAVERCHHEPPKLRELAPQRFVRCHLAPPPEPA